MKVDLGFFKGPLALLLYLIQKHEFDIMDIPLSKVADVYVTSLSTLDLDEIGDFLALATVLIMMKLRAILKKPQEEEEETISFYEIAEEYFKYRNVVGHLKDRAEIEEKFMPRPGEQSKQLPNFDSVLLVELIKEIERRSKIDIEIPEVKVERSEVEGLLEGRLKKQGFVELNKIFLRLNSIDACIMLFIIILDWVMHQRISVYQEDPSAPVLLRMR